MSGINNRYQKLKKQKLMYDPMYWRYVLNLMPSLRFAMNKPKLDSSQQAILDRLNKDGIVSFNFEELFGNRQVFDELQQFYAAHQQKYAAEINEQRENRGNSKSYIYSIRDKYDVFDMKNPMVKVAVNDRLMPVVNSYLGLAGDFRYYDIWQTFIANQGPVRSQNWHRDPEDYLMVKVFIYLNDVDETGGPFMYAKGSHAKGANFKDPEWYKEDGRNANRSSDENVEKIIPRSDWMTATGKAGTVILADTRGLHKGGFATHNERIMYNSMFVSPSSYFKPTFQTN